MKLTIEIKPELQEPEIQVRCREITGHLQKVIDLIRERDSTLAVQQDGAVKMLGIGSIYYIESVDDKTFVYSKGDVYSTELKLYETEELLRDTSFVRISKACILNIDILDSVRVLMNGKMEASLNNGEKLVINRHYVPDFKKKFGI